MLWSTLWGKAASCLRCCMLHLLRLNIDLCPGKDREHSLGTASREAGMLAPRPERLQLHSSTSESALSVTCMSPSYLTF